MRRDRHRRAWPRPTPTCSSTFVGIVVVDQLGISNGRSIAFENRPGDLASDVARLDVRAPRPCSLVLKLILLLRPLREYHHRGG